MTPDGTPPPAHRPAPGSDANRCTVEPSGSSDRPTPVRVPQRMCVGCRRRGGQGDLIRVVAVRLDGIWTAVPDLRRRLPGRGAWLHPTTECLDLTERRRAVPRALRVQGTVDLAQVRDLIDI